MESPDHAAPQILEELVHQAERAVASDIHLQLIGREADVSFRLDGVINPVTRLPQPVAERVFGRIKYLARLKTYQDSLPQDGRIDKGDLHTQTDLRVSTYPTVTGEKIVLRLFQEAVIPALEDLGLPADLAAGLKKFLKRSTGLLLLTGPAGSGKTTTIYACLQELTRTGGRHVISVEDPVERIVPGVMQTEVNEARGLTYAQAARHLLRQDPEVLVVGEIRDEETAQQVVRAALTGHLVISTLHAGSCRGVMDRLCMLCPDPSAVLTAVECLLNQRLLRRLCPACQGAGCGDCLQTGYRGRQPAAESFRLSETTRAAFRLEGSGVIQPRPSLAEVAREMVRNKVTTQQEYQRVMAP